MAEYRIRFVADTSAAGRSISDIQKAIKAVTKEFENAEIGAEDFANAAADLSTLNKELKDAKSAVIDLDRAYASLNKKIAAQHNAIMKFRAGMGARGAIPAEASPIRGTAKQFGSPAYFDALEEGLKKAIASAKEISPPPKAFDPYSLAAYEAKLKRLKDEARLIAPTTAPWKALTKEIVQTERAIENINKRQRIGPSLQQRAGAAGGAFLYGGGLGGGVGSATLGIAGGLLGGAPGAFAGAAVGQAVDNLTSYAAAMARTVAEVNKARIALAGVTRDAQDYDTAIAAASEASKTFLLPIDQSIRQFTRLQASVAGAGFETKDTQRVFNGISAAIIATGGSAEDLNGALSATAQVFSKGKVSAEELRQQIGERLPGAFTIFAESINKTPQELDKALEEGKVSLGDFLKFVDELSKRYAETAKILGDAPENAGARLDVALTAASVAYGGFFQQVGAGFQDYLTDLIEFTIQNERQFKTVIAAVKIAAEDLYSILSGAVKALFPVFESFFSYLFNSIARGLNAVATLAEQSRRAAGGPEKRAAAAVDSLYAGRPLEGHFGERRKAYEEALRVELEYDKKEKDIIGDRQSRIDELVKQWMTPPRPSQFGMGLGKGGATGGLADGNAKAAKAAKDRAAEEEARLQARIRGLKIETQATLQTALIRGRIAEAEMLGNKEMVARLRGEERNQEILVRYQQALEGVTDQREVQALKAKAQADLEVAGIELAIDLERLRLEVIKEQNDELFKRAGLTPQDRMAKGRGEFALDLPDLRVSPGERQMNKYKEELKELSSPINLAVSGADAIGDAFGRAYQEIASGARSTQEVLSNVFKSIAESFIGMAAQIIAKQLTMLAFQQLLRLFGGAPSFGFSGAGPAALPSGPGFAQGFSLPSLITASANGNVFGSVSKFANGGMFTDSIVSSPTFFQFADGEAFNLGLMGEAGPEAVMPLKRGPDGRLGVSMYDASRKAVANAGSNASMDVADNEDDLFSIGSPSAARRTVAAAAEAVAATRMQVMEQRTLSERRSEMRHIEEIVAKPAKINVEYQSQVINNVEYVTRDQAERMAAQSALRGRELALSSLQNSVKARKRVGMS